MLVLSRKIGEKLVMGDGIVLTVKRIDGRRVTLGIEAPKTVRIIRGELQPFPDTSPLAPPTVLRPRQQPLRKLLPARPR